MEEPKPRISVAYAENAITITLTDEKILEEADIKALEQSIMSVLGQGEQIKLILNFCNVQFLSSAVLGMLLRISKRVYEGGGQLRLCGINKKIYEIFKITRLNRVFDIYENESKALKSFD